MGVRLAGLQTQSRGYQKQALPAAYRKPGGEAPAAAGRIRRCPYNIGPLYHHQARVGGEQLQLGTVVGQHLALQLPARAKLEPHPALLQARRHQLAAELDCGQGLVQQWLAQQWLALLNSGSHGSQLGLRTGAPNGASIGQPDMKHHGTIGAELLLKPSFAEVVGRVLNE